MDNKRPTRNSMAKINPMFRAARCRFCGNLADTIEMKIITLAVLCLVLVLGSSLSVSNSNSVVFAFHFGTTRIYSDVYTGAGNSSAPINEFDPENRDKQLLFKTCNKSEIYSFKNIIKVK